MHAVGNHLQHKTVSVVIKYQGVYRCYVTTLLLIHMLIT
jgi:hypothetical protein